MITKDIAEILDGRDYEEFYHLNHEYEYARANGAVIVFGASDDLVEFRGAIDDEAGCYGTGTIYFNKSGELRSECEIDRCPYFEKTKDKASKIKAIWDNGEYSWTYETDIPHETFDILEYGIKYCRGIVFSIDDVADERMANTVPQVDFDAVKYIALSSMHTAETLMDECVGRADRIKELGVLVGEKDLRIADLESQRDMVRKIRNKHDDEVFAELKELEAIIKALENRIEIILNSKNKLVDRWNTAIEVNTVLHAIIDKHDKTIESSEDDLELLDTILEVVNPIIKSGMYAHPASANESLANNMHKLCVRIIQHRRKHGIVG